MPTSYLPVDLYRRNAKGVAGYLLSGSMAREILWSRCGRYRRCSPDRATDPGVIFKFAIADVDDINALQPRFDVAGIYNAKKALASFGASPTPRAASNRRRL